MKRIVAMVLACMVLSALVGCASIMHGTKQKITFTTSPSEAQVQVLDDIGISSGTCMTPCSLELSRKDKYKVSFYKDGYEPVEMVITRGSDGWIWGNILLGGIIGLIVDFSNGAAYKLSPSEMQTVLTPTAQGALPTVDSQDGLVMLDMDSLSELERERVRKLPSIPLSNL